MRLIRHWRTTLPASKILASSRMSSIFSDLSKAVSSFTNTLGLTKKRNIRNKNKNKNKENAAATPAPNAGTPAPPAETPGAPPTPGASQSAGKMMRAANLRYMKFYKPKKSTRRKGKKGKKSKKGTRRR